VWLRSLLSPLAPPLCCACGADAGSLEPLCRDCRARLRWLDRSVEVVNGLELWAPVAYHGPAAALVRELKFRSRARVADAMAAPLAALAPRDLLRDRVLVPVPLHPARLRRRGFNQAEELAVALGRRTGLPVIACLERRGGRATQMGRSRALRLAGLDGRVSVLPGAVSPERVLLVDDVITTGTTLAACAAAMRAAGAQRVAAVGYARTRGR
jgi:ComF family protein